MNGEPNEMPDEPQPNFWEQVAAYVKEHPSWFISLGVHFVIVLILAAITAATVMMPKQNIQITLDTVEEIKKLPKEEVNPFSKEESDTTGDQTNEDPLFLKDAVVWDHNEIQSVDDVTPAFQTDTLGVGRGVFGQRAGGGRLNSVARYGGSWGSEKSVEKGLDWLRRHQASNGSWSEQVHDLCVPKGSCGAPGEEATHATGLTGLGVLTFLGAGYTPDRGKFADTVSRGLKFLITRYKGNGRFQTGMEDTPYYQLYEEAIATWAMCEAYAMTKDESYRKLAEPSVASICERLKAIKTDFPFNMDTSVLGFCTMCLKSAGFAGLTVKQDALEGIGRWLGKVVGPDGSTAYQPAQSPSYSMTAVSAYVRELTGVKADDPVLRKQIAYIIDNAPAADEYYSIYYGTLATFHAGGDQWKTWNKKIRDKLSGLQQKQGCPTGSWNPPQMFRHTVCSTCMALLTLEIYYRYLPLYRVEDQFKDQQDILADIPKESPLYGAVLHIKAFELVAKYKAAKDDTALDQKTRDQHWANAVVSLKEFVRWAAENRPTDKDDQATVNDWNAQIVGALLGLLTEKGMYSDIVSLCREHEKARYSDARSNPEFLRIRSTACLKVAAQLLNQGKAEEAQPLKLEGLDALMNLIKVEPDQPLKIYKLAGDLLSEMGRFENASEVYKKADLKYGFDAANKKDMDDIRAKLAFCLAHLGRLDEAVDVQNQIDPTKKLGPYEIAKGLAAQADRAFQNDKKYDEAYSNYEMALKLMGGGEATADTRKFVLRIKMKLGLCCMELGKHAEAVPLLEAVRKEFPRAADVLDPLARAYTEVGNSNGGVTIYNELARMYDEGSAEWWKSRLGLAECLYRAKRFGDVISLVKVLEINFPDLGGGDIKRRLLEIEAESEASKVNIGR